MEAETVSRTALLMSYLRGYHSGRDSPRIFDDHLAWSLLSEDERAAFEQRFTPVAQSIEAIDPAFARTRPDDGARLAWAIRTFLPLSLAVSRARAAEDALEQAVQQGVRQYVLLGAGLDTFAFRHRELAARLRVFEVDHPATQAHKRRRLREVGWGIPEGLHFLPVDLARESLAAALKCSSYDGTVPSFFSWLGVTMYLTRDEVVSTLRQIAGIAPGGSAVVFDYLDADAFVPERASMRIVTAMEYTRRHGEPMKSGLDPATLAQDLAPLGFRLHEDLGPAEIEERYFRGRADGYHAYDHAHVARAVVDEAIRSAS
jgi:methyltransferase (TIGR00027 family)